MFLNDEAQLKDFPSFLNYDFPLSSQLILYKLLLLKTRLKLIGCQLANRCFRYCLQ